MERHPKRKMNYYAFGMILLLIAMIYYPLRFPPELALVMSIGCGLLSMTVAWKLEKENKRKSVCVFLLISLFFSGASLILAEFKYYYSGGGMTLLAFGMGCAIVALRDLFRRNDLTDNECTK